MDDVNKPSTAPQVAPTLSQVSPNSIPMPKCPTILLPVPHPSHSYLLSRNHSVILPTAPPPPLDDNGRSNRAAGLPPLQLSNPPTQPPLPHVQRYSSHIAIPHHLHYPSHPYPAKSKTAPPPPPDEKCPSNRTSALPHYNNDIPQSTIPHVRRSSSLLPQPHI